MADLVYLSYAERDQKWADDFKRFLRPYLRKYDLTIWDEHQDIHVGEIRHERRSEAIGQASLIVCLVTPDYLDKEFDGLQSLWQSRGLPAITWIPIRHSMVQETALGAFQPLWEVSHPLSLEKNPEKALLEIAQNLIRTLQSKRDDHQPDGKGPGPDDKGGGKKPPQPPDNDEDHDDSRERGDKKDDPPKPFDAQVTTLRPDPFGVRVGNNRPALGVEILAEELSHLLMNTENERGTMIGIFGEWGRGKSYLMEQIWNQLEAKENPFERVDFHAWKFQDTPASWAYLYEAITERFYFKETKPPVRKTLAYLRFLNQHSLGTWWRNGRRRLYYNLEKHGLGKFLFFFGSMLGIAILPLLNPSQGWLTSFFGAYYSSWLLILTLVSKLLLQHKQKAIDLLKLYTQKADFARHLGVQKEIQDEIKHVLRAWFPQLPGEKRRMLLVIEDLDRCNEQRLIQVIDSLRVMLEDPEISKRMVALVAVDERILSRAVHLKYLKMFQSKEQGSGEQMPFEVKDLCREYFDKLFLAGVKLPPLNSEDQVEILNAITRYDAIYPEETPTNQPEMPGPLKRPPPPDKKAPSVTKPVIDDPARPVVIPPTHTYWCLDPDMLAQVPGLEQAAVSEVLNQVYHSEAGMKEALIKVSLKPEALLGLCKKTAEMSREEYGAFKNLLKHYRHYTPRGIRILFYRYLLAKRLLHHQGIEEHPLPEGEEPLKPNLLMALLVHVTHQPDRLEDTSDNGALDPKEALKKVLEGSDLNYSAGIDEEYFKKLTLVLRMVVAY